MALAVEAVQEKKYTIREAAVAYHVPRSTIGDRVSGRIQMGAKSGPATYLTAYEEKELVDFLIGCARIGFARTRKQVMTLVRTAMIKKGNNDAPITNGWWDSFMKRHPQLTLRTPEKLAYVRGIMGNKEVIGAYFDLLEETLSKNGILDKPAVIFNVDETGMPLDHKPEKAIAEKGARVVTAHTSGDKTNITVIACGSAAGQVIPPMVLFQGKKLNHTFTIGEIPGTMYGMGSGWVDTELFEAWFADQFLAYAPKARPLLLMLDGHASHYQPELVRLAAKESVILFCLPPHCTHLAQPLDKGAFSPLKTYWHQECAKFMDNNPGEIVSKRNFSTIFAQAWYRAMTPKTIAASFRATGVYPFNREAIQIPEVSEADSDLDKGIISYLPLYSPAPKQSRVRTSASAPTVQFSASEEELFKTRHENGYDITTDHRYNQWLLQNTQKEDIHVHSATINECARPKEPSSIHEFLQIPELPSALKKNSEKKFRTARVLTSDVAIQQMEEKERRKKEEEERKERRKEEREERARVRAEQQAEKKRKAEEKKKEKEQAERQKQLAQNRKQKEQTQEKEEVGQKEKQKTRVQPERSKKHVPRRKAEALTENISGIIRVYVHMYDMYICMRKANKNGVTLKLPPESILPCILEQGEISHSGIYSYPTFQYTCATATLVSGHNTYVYVPL